MSEREERSDASASAWADRESELIEQCIREIPGYGETAFRCLVEHYEERVLRFAVRITGSQQDAEEVVQDTFRRVHRHIEGFDRRSAFPTWLFSIAKKESFRKLRRMCRTRRREQAIEREWEQRSGASWPESSGSGGRNRLREVFSSYLPGLRAEDRRILLLRVYQGLSLTEIAEALGIGLSAAKMRLSRAVRAVGKAYHLDGP